MPGYVRRRYVGASHPARTEARDLYRCSCVASSLVADLQKTSLKCYFEAVTRSRLKYHHSLYMFEVKPFPILPFLRPDGTALGSHGRHGLASVPFCNVRCWMLIRADDPVCVRPITQVVLVPRYHRRRTALNRPRTKLSADDRIKFVAAKVQV